MRFLSIAAGFLSILPLASLSALPNSQSLASEPALDSTLVDRAAPICNARGYQRSTSPYSSSKSSVQACGARCSKDAKCKNFAVGKGYCFLYNVALPNNFKANQRSPYYFSGKACYRPASSPPALSCGLVGYDPTKVATQFSTQQSSLAACSSLCKRSSKCKSMRYGRNTCVLYTASVTSKFSRDANSPFKFYDKTCTVSAPSTTSRTSSPGRTSTGLRSSTTRPAGTTSRTTAASSTRTGGASTSSRTTAATSVRGGNTSTTSRATATTSARASAGTTSTTTPRGISTTASAVIPVNTVERIFQEVVIAFDIPNNRGKRQSGGSSSSTSYFSNTISLSGANAGYRELTTDATNALKISLTIPPGSSGQVNKLELLAENQVNFADLTALALIANLASGDPWATGGPFLLGASLPGVGRETTLSSSPYSNSLRRQYISDAQSNNGAYVAQSPFWTLDLATNEIGAAVNNADGSSTPLVMYYDSGLVKFATSPPAGAQALKPKALLDDANVVTKTGSSTMQGPTAASTTTSSTIVTVPTCNSAVIGRPFTIGADTIVTLPGTSGGAEQIRDGVLAILFERQVIFSHNTKDLSGQTHNPAVFTLDSQCRLVSSESGQYATTGGASGDQVTLANGGSVTCYCNITTSLSCACGNNPTLGMDGINRLVVRGSDQQTNGKSANFRANFVDQQSTGSTTASTSSTASVISSASTTVPGLAQPTCNRALTGRPFTITADTIVVLPDTIPFFGEVPDGVPGVVLRNENLLIFTNKATDTSGRRLYPAVFTLDEACRLTSSSFANAYATTTSDASGTVVSFRSDASAACICDITTSLSCDCSSGPVLGLDYIDRLVAFKSGQQTNGKTAMFRVKFQDQQSTTSTSALATTTATAPAVGACTGAAVTADNGKVFNARCKTMFLDEFPSQYLDAPNFLACVNLCAAIGDCLGVMFSVTTCQVLTSLKVSPPYNWPAQSLDSALLRTSPSQDTSATTTLDAATASSTVGACDYYLEAGDNGGIYYAYCGVQIEVLETPGQLKHADSFHNCVSICNRDSSCKGINFDKQSTTNNCQLFSVLTYTKTESSRYDSAIFGIYVQETTTTTTISATTTSSAAAAATCSAPVVVSDNGKTFDTICGVYVGLDDGQASAEVNAKSFSECVNICASRSDCLAMRFDNEVVAFGQCHILTVRKREDACCRRCLSKDCLKGEGIQSLLSQVVAALGTT